MPSDVAFTLDSTTWAALALVLTLVGAGVTWLAWRRRGPASAVRALAWTLVPVAAWLTGTLRLVASILEATIDWAARLVFSPTVWIGLVVAGAAMGLWLLSGLMRARGIGARPRSGGRTGRAARRTEKQAAQSGRDGAPLPAPSASRGGAAPAKGRKGRDKDGLEDIGDLDDIEAILKRHGI